jgi:AmmeMemoRadiSam system protein A
MNEKTELVTLAKESIKSRLENKNFEPEEKTKEKFKGKRACFVTLTLNKELRGCIGSLTARQELWRDVVENAVNSAFNDPRFYPLTKKEFEKVKIEISILTPAKKIEYKDEEDLKKKIFKKGIIIKKGRYSATYLPQVWEQIPNKENFLNSLCSKAGLPPKTWKKKLDIWVYNVEKIEEKNHVL